VPCHLVAVGFDANDPARLARFWAEALGWTLDDTDADEITLRPSDGTPPEIVFQRVPEQKADQNPIHFDLTTASLDDQRDSEARLLALGAQPVDIGQTAADLHIVLADPEGNEFCLIEPQNRFLAGAPRLGSITCNGPPRVGYFWSAALDWPLVWDQDDETAIRAPDGTGPFVTWGPPVSHKTHKNRLHLDIAPPADGHQQAEVERLIALGARRIDIGQGDVTWVVMADPDGNEFCVLTPR